MIIQQLIMEHCKRSIVKNDIFIRNLYWQAYFLKSQLRKLLSTFLPIKELFCWTLEYLKPFSNELLFFPL